MTSNIKGARCERLVRVTNMFGYSILSIHYCGLFVYNGLILKKYYDDLFSFVY
jgi:hypothetical protein